MSIGKTELNGPAKRINTRRAVMEYLPQAIRPLSNRGESVNSI